MERFTQRWRSGGWRWLISAVLDRVVPARPHLRATVLESIRGRVGLEIGGPSRVFGVRGMLPVYRVAAQINNVNFAAQTTWETKLREGGVFQYDARRTPGTQWIREAAKLDGIADATHDFVLSSHCLEHLANPLAALWEWRRVTLPGGHLLVVLPDPARSFDHRRPITTLAHLRDDFTRDAGEDDDTHFAEVLALHDLSRDPGLRSADEFRERVRSNAQNRCVHHHVFDLALMAAALAETGWRVLTLETARPLHLIAWAQKQPS